MTGVVESITLVALVVSGALVLALIFDWTSNRD